MASLRIAFAYLSISMISVVLFIIFVGVFLRSCFRTTKKPARPVVASGYRKETKRDYGGATERQNYSPPPKRPEEKKDEEVGLLGTQETKT
mmetsp:Transcript_7664/g.10665  ORF Transcript_7664/g.10665 Transcript_7664/m.10665 type:complete len:91 (-) Transcript_7664:351-623(-)